MGESDSLFSQNLLRNFAAIHLGKQHSGLPDEFLTLFFGYYFQQLRKLMLEIILRTSTNEALKNLTKEIQKAMLRLLTIENEENAILTIKILLDQGKASRFQFSQEASF